MTFGIFKENSRLRKMKYLVTLKFYQIVNKQIYKNVAAKLASKTRKSEKVPYKDKKASIMVDCHSFYVQLYNEPKIIPRM